MTDYSWITNTAMSMLTSGAFWAIVILGGASLGMGVLYFMKRRKFKTLTFVATELGNGKMGFTQTLSGYFSKNRRFGILWEGKGQDECITKDFQVIYGLQPEDYHEFNFQRCIFVTPSIDDPQILVPINKMFINEKKKDMLFDMPSLEIREAAIDAFQKTTKEMKDWREQVIQYVVIGLIVIMAFLVILFVTNYASHNIDKSTEAVTSVGSNLRAGMENLSSAVGTLTNKVNQNPAP